MQRTLLRETASGGTLEGRAPLAQAFWEYAIAYGTIANIVATAAAIAAVLNFFGIPPGPYLAGVWIGVKVVIVLVLSLLGYRMVRKQQQQSKHDGPAKK